MRSKNAKFVGGIILCVLVAAFGATSALAAKEEGPIKIGDLGPQTGVYENWGKYETMGIQMAVDEINAKGGLLGRKIEVVTEDTQANVAIGSRKAEKLILQDKVSAIFGATSSGVTLAVMEVTKKYKTIQMNSISCAEFMRTSKLHPYFFQLQPDSRMQAVGAAGYINKVMGKKVFIFYVDYAMGQSDGRQFKTELEKIGGEIVGIAAAPMDTKDFTPWFGQIRAAKPEVLFLAFAGNDSIRLITQLHSFGLTKEFKLAGIDCFLLETDLPGITEAMEGFVQLNHYSTNLNTPESKAFTDAFMKRYGGAANMAASLSYDAVILWAEAVKRARTLDPDKVAKALEGLRMTTHMGDVYIRPEDHALVTDLWLYRVEKGKMIPIMKLKGEDIVGEAMVGKDPLAGFTWEIKKAAK